jgi:hypothetical protein
MKKYTNEEIIDVLITSTLLDINLNYIDKIKDINQLYNYNLKNTGTKFSKELNISLDKMLDENETLDEFIEFKVQLKKQIESFSKEIKNKLLLLNQNI